MPVFRFILHMRHRDGDTAGFFLRRVVNRVEGANLHFGVILRQYLGNGRRQRGLAMIDMPDRADVDVRFAAIEFFLCHCNNLLFYGFYELYGFPAGMLEPLTRIELVTSSLPRTRSTN